MNNCQEINIIKIFSSAFSNHKNGEIGVGDDCAVIPIDDDKSMVITTDTMTEDVHFIMGKISPEDLAYKSLASNISDVISMGALPTYAFLSITLTKAATEEWIKRFSDSFNSLAKKHNIKLMGGDTTFSPHAITVTITLLGEVATKNLKLRSGAKIGDKIFCCNTLGASAAGLKLILEGVESHPFIDYHYRPSLFVDQSQWLAEQSAVSSMMDISDGIAKDLTHILERSGVGAVINLENIPISEPLIKICKTIQADPLELALEGGEEYSLLFTVSGDQSDTLSAEYFKTFNQHIYEIGEIVATKNVIMWVENGTTSKRTFKGYDHFRDDR